MPNIRPSSELRNNYAGIMKECRDKQIPIFLTVNGRGDSVIIPIEQYEREQAVKKLSLLLEEAETDIKEGNLYSHEQVFSDISKMLNDMKTEQA